ncbi:MAG: hypothetical protein N4A72_23010 [Bacteroidales bacterium]|nr:hypothetical protein [Bacteroidales bacterium]
MKQTICYTQSVLFPFNGLGRLITENPEASCFSISINDYHDWFYIG